MLPLPYGRPVGSPLLGKRAGVSGQPSLTLPLMNPSNIPFPQSSPSQGEAENA
jgi:hypothetical protein